MEETNKKALAFEDACDQLLLALARSAFVARCYSHSDLITVHFLFRCSNASHSNDRALRRRSLGLRP